MTPSQCRIARDLLDWSVADLARAAGVSVITVRKFEGGKMAPTTARTSVSLMRRALEGAGIRFSRDNGEGAVRLGPKPP